AVTDLLVRVTETGTGKQARIEGFTVAGKTGTAQKVDPHTHRYSARDRMSSFVGFVPAEDPALVMLVVIDSPRAATYGGVVAAPVSRAGAAYGSARRGVVPHGDRPPHFDGDPPGDSGEPPVNAADRWHLLQQVSSTALEVSTAGGMPSFVGLG